MNTSKAPAFSGTTKTGQESPGEIGPAIELPEFERPDWEKGDGRCRFHYHTKPLGSRAAWACAWRMDSRSVLSADSWMPIDTMSNTALLVEVEDVAHREGAMQNFANQALGKYAGERFSEGVVADFRRTIKRARAFGYPEYVCSWDPPAPEVLENFHTLPERLGWELERKPFLGVMGGMNLDDWDPGVLAQKQAEEEERLKREALRSEVTAKLEKEQAAAERKRVDRADAERVLSVIEGSTMLQKKLYDAMIGYAGQYGLQIKTNKSGVVKRPG